MWNANGQRLKVLRRRLDLTQEDLARSAGVSRRTVQRIEAGLWANLAHGAVRRVAEALGARVRVVISWNGEQLDRLVDAGHADLQNAFATLLTAAGWLVAVEVSFNHYGDRGRYDILAFHSPTHLLLVVEVKTGIGDVQALLGALDMKLRLAASAAQRQGWPRPAAVVPTLVIADERQQHRLVGRHAALFARFAVRGRSARAWLRRPTPEPSGLLLYLPMTNARLVSVRNASRGRRIRHSPAAVTHAPQSAQRASVSRVSPT